MEGGSLKSQQKQKGEEGCSNLSLRLLYEENA